jgi:RNA polymerase primary sigma factor
MGTGSVALLTRAEEGALARGIQTGCARCLDALVRSNLPFVLKVARQYRGRGVLMEDLVAEGNLGLLEAARRFDPGRGTKFITYAMWWIRKRILQAFHDRAPLPGIHLSLDWAPDHHASLLDRLPDPAAVHPELALLGRADRQVVRAALARLTHRERHVLSLRYGLDGEAALTLKEAGERVRLSRERIRQIETRALGRLARMLRPGPAPRRGYDASHDRGAPAPTGGAARA